MKTILIEIEADKRVLNEQQYRLLADRLESTCVWFGLTNIIIKVGEMKDEDK